MMVAATPYHSPSSNPRRYAPSTAFHAADPDDAADQPVDPADGDAVGVERHEDERHPEQRPQHELADRAAPDTQAVPARRVLGRRVGLHLLSLVLIGERHAARRLSLSAAPWGRVACPLGGGAPVPGA